MDIKREWRKAPPKEPVDSLEALVRDFQWRFPRERRDMVVEFCRAAPDWDTAMRRAVNSKDEGGKHHHHQSRVAAVSFDMLIEVLAANKEMLQRCSTFDSLHDAIFHLVAEERKRNRGTGCRCHHGTRLGCWGPTGVYDVSVRLGTWMGIEPTSVYLHTGVRIGWYALLEATPGYTLVTRLWASIKRVPHEHLPEPLRVLPADEVEDFLCTYRSVFAECLTKEETEVAEPQAVR